MTRHLLTLIAMFVLAGCAPETRTRVVDRPDVEPMELPEFGWAINYTRTVTDAAGDTFVEEPTSFECWIAQHEYGAAMNMCGFQAYVGPESFSLNGEPFSALSWFYGPFIAQISGSGDAEGSDLVYRGERYDGDLIFRLDYDITNVGPLELPPEDAFAPVQRRTLFEDAERFAGVR